VGVQAENAAPYIASLAAGEPRQVPVVPTIADGIAVYRPGELNFAIIRDTIDEVVTVTEDDIARALLVLLERAKLVVEPAGAVAVAAMMTGAVQSDGPVVAVLSGGNIDPLLMQRVVAHGLAASDRYLTISVGLPDRPGQLARVARRTPMESSQYLAERLGLPVYLKCENLQRTGSYKLRGASNRIAALSDAERARGVVAASAGNHAQGVALAAQALGIRASVFMPEGAPIPKEKATRGYGAEVVFHGRYLEDSLAEAREFERRTGAVLIHPFDNADIVAGQGTCGLEILEQAPDVETVVVPCGGGGLLSGIAVAVKAQRPQVRMIGVQAAGAAAFPGSLEAGRPVKLESMSTMADGIAVGLPGEVTFTAVRDLVDEIVTVSEGSLSRAVLAVLERAKMVVEPAGAAAVAAVLDDPSRFGTPTVAVLSGGNIDPLLLGKVIQHGMAAAGRYLNLRLRIPDSPGGLAHLLTDISRAGANVIEVSHARIDADLSLDEVEVHLQLETRGAKHAEALVASLRDHGYQVLA
jgi:threonine dehydratase